MGIIDTGKIGASPFANVAEKLKDVRSVDTQVEAEAFAVLREKITDFCFTQIDAVVQKYLQGSLRDFNQKHEFQLPKGTSLVTSSSDLPVAHFSNRGLKNVKDVVNRIREDVDFFDRVKNQVSGPIIQDLEDAGFRDVDIKFDYYYETVVIELALPEVEAD